MLILSSSFVHCFVWCVWVRISRPCMLLLALDVPFSVGLCLCASRVVSFLGAAGLLFFSEEKRLPFAACFQMLGAIVNLSEMPQGRILVRNKLARLDDIAQLVEAISFVAAARCFWCGCRLVFALVAWVLAVWPALSWFPPPPWLSSGVFWSSQCSAGPSLRISGCICNGPVVIPLAWRVVADWLLSSLRFMATKASALCGALPSTPCCGCCSCTPCSGTDIFALG